MSCLHFSSVDDIVYAHDSDSDFDEPYDSKASNDHNLDIFMITNTYSEHVSEAKMFRGTNWGTDGYVEHPALLWRDKHTGRGEQVK